MFAVRPAVLAVAAVVLLAGCVSGAPAESASWQNGTPQDNVPVDNESTLALNPVDYGNRRVVVATFSEPIQGRRVDLQHRAETGWEVAASANEDANGRVEFLAPYSDGDYRAVAQASADGAHTAVATTSQSEADQWKLDFSEGFDGTSLDSEYWSPRQTGSYYGSRLCSAPYPSNLALKDGSLLVSVRKANAARTQTVAANAAARMGVPASQACPNGVWDAAMVSTEGKYTFRYGVVAVRAKFPTQPGVHGSVWLQRVDPKGAEIDFIETFGLKYGIQHKVHYDQNGESVMEGGYVKSLPEVKNEAWWNQYHVFSVEWTKDEYVFRVDGVETLRTRSGISQGQEFIILSMLASDWELKRVVPDEMPATMAVDWVKVWKAK
jgi:beta-glucanase (GH16 family)